LTVCIASICHAGTMIVGASDRMITSGEDTEFEVPTLSETRQLAPVLKTVRLDNYIIAMTSGDSGFQADAMQNVLARCNELKQQHPNSRLRVRDAARLYVDFCNEAKRQASTDIILSRLGLDLEGFYSRQANMSPEFIRLVTEQLFQIVVGDPVIFAGIDDIGTQIYQANGDGISSCNMIGWVAIGIGGRHAESQFMLAEHTRLDSFGDTALLTYIAKKRSQVAPGVGKQTDMFWINDRGYQNFSAEHIDALDKIYKKLEDDQGKALSDAKAAVHQYIEEEKKREAQKRAKNPPEPPPPNPSETST